MGSALVGPSTCPSCPITLTTRGGRWRGPALGGIRVGSQGPQHGPVCLSASQGCFESVSAASWKRVHSGRRGSGSHWTTFKSHFMCGSYKPVDLSRKSISCSLQGLWALELRTISTWYMVGVEG